MARLWSCGFELQSVVNGVEWDTTTGSPTINTALKRSGAASLRCNPTAATAYITHRVDSSGQNNKLYFRVYIYINTLPNSLTDILGIYSSYHGTWNVAIRLNSNGTLELWKSYPSTAQIGSDSDALNTGQWYRIEITCEASGSSGTLRGHIEGVEFASDTNWASDGYPDTAQCGVISSATCDLYFDDLAMNDDSNSYQNSLPGAGSILHLWPNAAGDNLPTAGTFADVDEKPTPDDDTSYIELDTNSTTIGDFNIEDWPGNPNDVITLVQVGNRERAETAASESWVLRIKSQSAGTTLEGSTTTHNDVTWKTNGDVLPLDYKLTSYTDPQGGGSWTPALLNTAQIGVRSVDADPDIWVSTLWALVEYIAAVGGQEYYQTNYATLSFASGILTPRCNKVLQGVLSFSGALSRFIDKTVLGGLSFAGSISKQANKGMVGALSFVGGLTSIKVFLKTVEGVLSFSGSLIGEKIVGFIEGAFIPVFRRRKR